MPSPARTNESTLALGLAILGLGVVVAALLAGLFFGGRSAEPQKTFASIPADTAEWMQAVLSDDPDKPVLVQSLAYLTQLQSPGDLEGARLAAEGALWDHFESRANALEKGARSEKDAREDGWAERVQDKLRVLVAILPPETSGHYQEARRRIHTIEAIAKTPLRPLGPELRVLVQGPQGHTRALPRVFVCTSSVRRAVTPRGLHAQARTVSSPSRSVPRSRLGICAYGGGWVSRDLANRSTLASFLTLDAPSSGSTLAHEVVPCARFQGKFVDPKGEGLWGAHLVAVPEGGDSLPWATITGIAKRTTETEKKGAWTIEGLIPGLTYDIQARSSDGDVRAARQCKAPTGPDEGSPIVLRPVRRIEVRVFDTEQKPVPTFSVFAVDETRKAVPGGLRVRGLDGRVTIDALDWGETVSLQVESEEYLPPTEPQKLSGHHSAPSRIRHGQEDARSKGRLAGPPVP